LPCESGEGRRKGVRGEGEEATRGREGVEEEGESAGSIKIRLPGHMTF